MDLEVFHRAILETTTVESFVKECFHTGKLHSSRLEPYCEGGNVLRKKTQQESVFETSVSILL